MFRVDGWVYGIPSTLLWNLGNACELARIRPEWDVCHGRRNLGSHHDRMTRASRRTMEQMILLLALNVANKPTTD